MLCRIEVKSGGEIDMTKFPSLQYPFNKALIWLPCCLIFGFEKNGQSRVSRSYRALLIQSVAGRRPR